jgi:hypothetical protein
VGGPLGGHRISEVGWRHLSSCALSKDTNSSRLENETHILRAVDHKNEQGKVATSTGKFLVVWKKQPSGEWKAIIHPETSPRNVTPKPHPETSSEGGVELRR